MFKYISYVMEPTKGMVTGRNVSKSQATIGDLNQIRLCFT